MQDGIEVVDQWAKKGHQRGKQWLFRVWDPEKRNWKSKAFAKKGPGWTWAEKKRAQFNLGEATTGSLAFELVATDHCDSLKERGLAPKYRAEVRRVADAVIAAGAVDLLSDDFEKKVRAWITTAPTFAKGYGRPASNVTKNRWLDELRSICDRAVGKFGLRKNPLAEIRDFKVDKKLPRTLRVEEMRAMVAPAMRRDRYFRAACFMVYGGMRIGEGMHVRGEWLDFEARTIHIRVVRDASGAVIWAPKRNKERIIPMMDELAEILLADKRLPRKGWVVTDAVLRELEDKNQWRAFRSYLERCGIEPGKLHPHATRHTWASCMLATGENQFTVSDGLGHEKLDTTAGYVKAQAAFTRAVAGWPRGQFCLRREPAATTGTDQLSALRDHLARGGAIADVRELEELLRQRISQTGAAAAAATN